MTAAGLRVVRGMGHGPPDGNPRGRAAGEHQSPRADKIRP